MCPAGSPGALPGHGRLESEKTTPRRSGKLCQVATVNGDHRQLSVGIVGAGFGGVGLGIRLRQEGFGDFTIFERGETVGGVWRANTYPGAAWSDPRGRACPCQVARRGARSRPT